MFPAEWIFQCSPVATGPADWCTSTIGVKQVGEGRSAKTQRSPSTAIFMNEISPKARTLKCNISRQTLFYIITITKQITIKSIVYFLHTSNYWFIGLKEHYFALVTFYGEMRNFLNVEKGKFPK